MVFEIASSENRARSTCLPRMPHFCPGAGGAGAKNHRAPRACDRARAAPYKCCVEQRPDGAVNIFDLLMTDGSVWRWLKHSVRRYRNNKITNGINPLRNRDSISS